MHLCEYMTIPKVWERDACDSRMRLCGEPAEIIILHTMAVKNRHFCLEHGYLIVRDILQRKFENDHSKTEAWKSLKKKIQQP